jgi:hypothetical protein
LDSPERLKEMYRAENMDEVFRTIVGRSGKEDSR